MIVTSTSTVALPAQCCFRVSALFPAAASLIHFFACVPFVEADGTQPGVTQESTQPSLSVLDGMSFSGELVGPGIAPGKKDTVVFQNGMFLSKECQKKCGYADGPYWVRSHTDGVQFKAETPCLTSDAKIVWTGTVKGDEIEGTFTWTSERWYWTIEKEFSFKGTLTNSDISATE